MSKRLSNTEMVLIMRKHSVVWILLAIIIFSLTACSSTNSVTKINKDITKIKEFEVSTDLPVSNTVIQGNAYIQQTKYQTKIIVIASIIVGENDFAGVWIYIPNGWYVSSALSSYPDDSGNVTTKDISIWSTGSTEPTMSYWSFIQIGYERDQLSTGGGTGTVYLELSKKNVSSNNFSMMIYVGSEINNDGEPVIGTASAVVEFDIE